ncbi:MAG: hypothetical protein PF440_09610 [Thiomicrorhabdus sp.]|nr:hypothetical protein [Thiomicrorhabdus sp.]
MNNIIIMAIRPSYANKEDDLERAPLLFAVIAREEVFNRISEFNWPMHSKISIPALGRQAITLGEAIELTLDSAEELVQEIGIDEKFKEVMEGGQSYYEYEQKFQHLL